MSSSETLYSARLASDWLERGRAQKVKCPVYLDGALAAPTSGTVTIYNAAGVAVIDAAAVTVTGSIAEYALIAGDTSGGELGLGWRIEWSLLMPDTVTHIFRIDSGLVRRRLYPVISDIDLKRRHTDLDDLRDSGSTSYQDFLDEAWQDILSSFPGHGARRPSSVAFIPHATAYFLGLLKQRRRRPLSRACRAIPKSLRECLERASIFL